MKIVHISPYPPKDETHVNTGGVAGYTKNLIANIPYSSDDEVYVLCDMIDGKYETYKKIMLI